MLTGMFLVGKNKCSFLVSFSMLGELILKGVEIVYSPSSLEVQKVINTMVRRYLRYGKKVGPYICFLNDVHWSRNACLILHCHPSMRNFKRPILCGVHFPYRVLNVLR